MGSDKSYLSFLLFSVFTCKKEVMVQHLSYISTLRTIHITIDSASTTEAAIVVSSVIILMICAKGRGPVFY